MRRPTFRLIALVLLLLNGAVALDAQWLRVLRRKSPPGADAFPAISFVLPTAQSAFQTNASSIDIGGTFADDHGVNLVTWVNDRGGSGTANLDEDEDAWDVTASGGSGTIGQDTFAVLEDTALPSVTPPIGMAWVERVDTTSNDTCQAYVSSASVGPSATRSSEVLMCSLTPSGALSGADYLVRAVRADVAAVSSSVEAGLFFAYVDASNYCSVTWFGAANSVDLRMHSVVAGVVTTLDNDATAVPVGAVVTVDVDGTAVKTYVDGVERHAVTSAACGTTGQAGVFFGSARLATGSNIQHVSSRTDDFEIIDRGATTTSVPLASGVNIITVTARDTAGQTSIDVLTVTRGVSDTELPVLSIQQPTSAPTYTTALAALTVSGPASDNVGVDSVTWACPQCSVTSGTATGTTSWTFNVTLGCSAGGTANVITVDAVDAALNSAVDKVLTVTCDSADVVNPTVSIVSPASGATYDAGTATSVILSGTAGDTGGSGLSDVSWSNSTGGSGVASGTTAWTTTTITLALGSNVITITARDGAGNTATDVLTVTSTPACAITTTSMPAAIVGAAYSFQLVASNCAAPIVWGNNSGGTTLRDADTHCAGLTVSAGGLVSASNPTTNGDCTWTANLTDDNAATDTQALTIVVQAASSGADAYWTTFQARGDVWAGRQWDLRQPGVITAVSGGANPWITYDFAGDTDAHKQDAAKIVIPAFKNWGTLASSMDDSATYWGCQQTVVPGKACVVFASWAAATQKKWFRVGSEIMQLYDPDGSGPLLPYTQATREAVFTRAHNNTSLAAHAAGSVVQVWNNDLPQQAKNFDLNTEDGYTYFWSWDNYLTDSHVGELFDQQKTFQFVCRLNVQETGKICFEPNYQFHDINGGPTNLCNASTGFVGNSDAAAFKIRVYMHPGGEATWTDSTGEELGPGVTNDSPLCPMANQFVVRPNCRTRHFVRIEQRASDYDYLTYWLADCTRTATKVIDALPVSLDRNSGSGLNGITRFWIEMDTSADDVVGSRSDLRSLVSYFWWLGTLRQAGLVGATTLTDAALASAGLLAQPQ